MPYLDLVGVGDSIDHLAQVPDDSLDACLCDPPYGLGEPPDPAAVMLAWARGEPFVSSGKGFMYKDWDAFVPGPELWNEVFRVLKPGAWCLVFAGTRTQDWMSIALRFSGFEIVDTMQWLYGQGFPKSLDISKAIDALSTSGRSDSHAIKHANDEVRTGGERERKRDQRHGGKGLMDAEDVGSRTIRDEPATEEGKAWEGWGTALKPAHEPIIVARKPIEGTYAENVLKHGCGGININGCRVAGTPEAKHSDGRWPANVLLDPAAADLLDEQGEERGVHSAGHARTGSATPGLAPAGMFGMQSRKEEMHRFGDGGGPSRFFYTSKASTKERWGYCRKCNEVFRRDARDAHSEHKDEVVLHPTQKPEDLMEYLVRLVTPPGGVVLDPFCGTGTTAVAAKRQGVHFVTCDLSSDYAKIAEARLAATGATASSFPRGAFFCPGCKARGEIKLLSKEAVERMRADGRKVTCSKCMKRYSYEDLTQ